MPDSDVGVKVSFRLMEEAGRGEFPFADVASSSWYYPAVEYVWQRQLMNGVSESSFNPAGGMTRSMIVQILYNREGRPAEAPVQSEGSTGNNADENRSGASSGAVGSANAAGSAAGSAAAFLSAGFLDVSADAWYADAVSWASSVGVVEGYGNGTFGPEERITREQMAAVFCRYAKYKGIDTQNREDLKKFTDAESVSGWALDSISWCAANSILSGTSDGRIQPGNTATRAEAAQILMNFCENVSENNPSA